jgi:hypothetical protein
MGFWRNKAVSAWGVLRCSAERKREEGSRGVPWSLGRLGLLLRTLGGKPWWVEVMNELFKISEWERNISSSLSSLCSSSLP